MHFPLGKEKNVNSTIKIHLHPHVKLCVKFLSIASLQSIKIIVTVSRVTLNLVIYTVWPLSKQIIAQIISPTSVGWE